MRGGGWRRTHQEIAPVGKAPLTAASVEYWVTDWKAIYTYEFGRASLELLFMIESSTLAWLECAKCPTYDVAVIQQSTSVVQLFKSWLQASQVSYRSL